MNRRQATGDGRRAAGARESARQSVDPNSCVVVRVGHGANCSSIGSVIDTLFIGATVGGAILAAVCAAMKEEGVTVVGPPAREEKDEKKEERS